MVKIVFEIAENKPSEVAVIAFELEQAANGYHAIIESEEFDGLYKGDNALAVASKKALVVLRNKTKR